MGKNNKLSIKEAERLAMKYVNKERVKQGKDKLKFNKALYKASKECSKVHADQKKVTGSDLRDRVKRVGYNSSYVEENCTSVPIDIDNDPGELARKLGEQWMKGRGHRANILNNSFKDTGIGIWISGDTAYASQVFGKGPAKKRKWSNLANLKTKLGFN